MAVVTKENWGKYLQEHPQAHILQTPEWGELKAEYGWQVERLQVGEIGAQVLFRKLPLGFSIGYIPRGPVLPDQKQFSGPGWNRWIAGLDELADRYRAVFIKLEPDRWASEVPADQDPPSGFRCSPGSIQPARTLVVSLAEEDDEILGRMKSKTRYNIRLAARKDVVVERTDDIQVFYQMLEKTSQRADFGIHSREYYRRAFELLQKRGYCALFTARFGEQPLASIMVFQRGNRAWYFYGASSPEHRDRMPTYRVQWEAMRWAKDKGCRSYDLWGVPDEDFETLEDQFLDRSDGLWGVYRFKRGFGGTLKRTAGSWDRVYRPLLYQGYRLWSRRQ